MSLQERLRNGIECAPWVREEVVKLEAELSAITQRAEAAESAITRLGDLLERICDIVKGRAPEGESYSYHDLPEELTKLLAEAKSKAVPEGLHNVL